MTAIQNIDFETFKWVKDEVSVTLRRAEEQMQSYVRTGDKSELFNLVNLFHQVVGSLQMLELKSLSSLMLESEELIEDYSDKSSDIRRASFVVLMDSSLSILNQNLDRIENGLRERPVEIVELVNQIRTVRGLEDVEISSLFSPMIDVFPEIDSTKALKDKVYIKRASALRTHYQMALLAFLKEESSDGVHKMRLVFDKVLEMSTFGTVARLWWVASAYADFLRLNEITNRSVHTRILRRIDDLLRNLAATGESALVSDPGEELIKIMLFYTATAEQRTDRIEEIVAAFALEGYFGDEELAASQEDINQAVRGLIAMSSTVNEPVVRTKQLVTDYFESDTPTDAQLLELAQQLEIILTAARENNVEILARLTQEALNVVRGIRDGVVAADDETGFHLASAIIFIENCVSFPNEFDNFAFETGSLKLSALNALNTSAPLTTEMDGTQLSGRERKELIRVVGTEIEENLKDIESRLELFAVDRSRADELTGIADKVTQVRGALQVLGEQKVGLLLSIAEHEFRAVELQHKEATPELVEALAIAIGTMEEYVKGLQSGRVGMDYILDRSITDLEVAIGKKVLRGDVEALLESASSSLFAWLGDQSNFELFTQLKSSLRDLTVLARKTKLSDVEHLVNEQDRIIDVISQEPAFLNDNIISSLQNNMVSITENVIQLYGTKDTDEELKIDSQLAQRKSPISKTTDGMRIHDAMDLSEIGEEITFENDERSTTIIAKEHAQKGDPLSKVDQAVFDAFLQEAEELVNEAKGYHRACEDDLDDREAIRNLRRVFHTLKGSARMVGLENIGEIAWLNESIFNYVLDTGKPMTLSALTFAKKTLAEIDEHRQKGFRTGEKINVTSWGTEAQQLSTAIVDSPDAETQKRTTPVMTLKDSPFANAEQNEEPSAAEEGHEADEILEEQGPDIEVIDEDDFEEDHTLIEWTVEAEDESSIQSASIVSEPSDAEELIELVTTDQSEIPDDDDDIVEIDVESSLDVDISDVIEIATEDFVEAESVLELDLSDVDPDEELELVIPFELDEDEDRGSDPVSPAIADSEIESDYLSFSVIEDVAMRKVFVEEASASIQDIRDLVAQPDRAYGTDDELSIKLHTLLGNARTLGLSALATAFHEAEELCSVRHRSAEVVSAADRALFTELTDLTDDVLKSEQSDDPYFTVDTEAWQAVSQGFKQAQEVVPERNNDALDLESLNIELELLSDLDSQEPEFEELESQESEALKSANDDEELVDAQSLLQPETDSELEVLSDELEQIEESIAQFKKEQKLERETPVLDLTQQDEDFEIDVAQEADEEDQDELPATTQQPRQSLIPDELTNLLRDEEVSASSEEVQVDTKDVAQPLLDAENVISDSVLAAVGDVGTQLAEAESDDESVDEAIREVFLTEMAQLQGQLDNEVAKLNDLSAAPSAMPIILQHLHTIKGSALVAEATELGSLTHDVESYLETTTIKSSEDVVKIKQTLESFVDDFDRATSAYKAEQDFSVSDELAQTLGLADQPAVAEPSKEPVSEIASEPDEALDDEESRELQPDEFAEAVSEAVLEYEKAHSAWKSARGWQKIKPQFDACYTSLQQAVSAFPPAEVAASRLQELRQSTEQLQPSNAGEFRQQKALLQECFDQLATELGQLKDNHTEADFAAFDTGLQTLQALISGDAVVGQNPESFEAEPDTSQEEATEQPVDEPADDSSTSPSSAKTTDTDVSQPSRATATDSALRIKTETLDSLTNFVGDASMNRSQMRDDVDSLKGVVSELFKNVERFGSQLRELEIEAETSMAATTNKQQFAEEKSTEFDPLELDRFTKLQSLSRGLTDNLDDLGEIQTALNDFVFRTENSLQQQDRLNRELQDEIMQVRMVSFGGIAPQLRQLVRRTARELGKQVQLELIGTDVRLDKTILDGVTPALEHMLRNAVDHGIELPADRKSSGKPANGSIVVECRQVAREIVISVTDDGYGLNLEKIQNKAVESNLLEEGQPLNPEDMMIYISQSGFSTADALTEISGRGVGMDVVQTSLRRLSGSVSYDLENPNPGSRFILNLPISLAVSSAMFVQAGDTKFAVPARVIERIIKLETSQLQTLFKRADAVIELSGKTYKLIDLADYLGVNQLDENDPAAVVEDDKRSVILVDSGVQNIAVVVDELLDTKEIVVKNLGDHLGLIPIYAGATIQPNGDVVLVLDLVGISYYESTVALPDRSRRGVRALPLVMVIDDSLTVRKAAERDLTALGIDTVLVRNGLDAMTQIAESKPDMILLDIEMPEMDGFAFLEWLRSESVAKDVPVVMISSRSTGKYIQKANDLGCNAFLSKPYLLDSLIELFNEYLPLETPLESIGDESR